MQWVLAGHLLPMQCTDYSPRRSWYAETDVYKKHRPLRINPLSNHWPSFSVQTFGIADQLEIFLVVIFYLLESLALLPRCFPRRLGSSTSHQQPDMTSKATMGLLKRGNDALNINPLPDADSVLSLHGSDWLWAVTAVHVAAFVSCVTIPIMKHAIN